MAGAPQPFLRVQPKPVKNSHQVDGSYARIQLRVYTEPGQAEVFVNIKRRDGGYYTRAAVVDTGAQTSLMPDELMPLVEYRLSERGRFMLEQAGIAAQAFEATEAYVTVFLEDMAGARTAEFEARVWFTDTIKFLIGFSDILDQAVLHLDMPHLTGYLDFAADLIGVRHKQKRRSGLHSPAFLEGGYVRSITRTAARCDTARALRR